MADHNDAKPRAKTRTPGGRRPPGRRRRVAGFGRALCVAAAGHMAGGSPAILDKYCHAGRLPRRVIGLMGLLTAGSGGQVRGPGGFEAEALTRPGQRTNAILGSIHTDPPQPW